jgi:hypothetical protein
MKYSELEKKLSKFGCYEVESGDHPIWFSPTTGQRFKTSNHKSQEVKKRNIEQYFESSGVEITPAFHLKIKN